MSDGVSVPASDFALNFAKYQDEAVGAKVINVTSQGRVIGAYLSAGELAHYETLKRREREVLIAGELDDETVSAIEAAQYGAPPL